MPPSSHSSSQHSGKRPTTRSANTRSSGLSAHERAQLRARARVQHDRVAQDHTPHRPDSYHVEHRPRRVVRAHELPPESTLRHAKRPKNSEPRKSVLASRWRAVRFGPWEWIGLGVSCVACVFLLREIAGAQGDHQMLARSVDAKQTQLAALDKQRDEESKKLTYLKSEKGREQILAQRGYLKPGDRILLFPEPKAQSEEQ